MSRNAPQRLLGGAAFTAVAFACTWTLCTNVFGTGAAQIDVADTRGDRLAVSYPLNDKQGEQEIAGGRGDRLAVAPLHRAAHRAAHLVRYAGFSDPQYWGLPTAGLTHTASLEERDVEIAPSHPVAAPRSAAVRDVPMTSSVPARDSQSVSRGRAPATQPTRIAPVRPAVVASVDNPPPKKPSIFERLFGKPLHLTLAYAASDDGGMLGSGSSVAGGRYDRRTAVYDISAHTVYMPDGRKLEAHSGRGTMLDDPRYAAQKDWGVTPPDVYDLEPRAGLFHGVRALRLIPQDKSKVFGRTGLLAHSFMLGPDGASLGCVSFRDYEAFRRAYEDGEITRLVVVTRL